MFPFLSKIAAVLLGKAVAYLSGKALTISADAVMVALAVAGSMWLWHDASTASKVVAALLPADAVAMYLSATGRIPFLSGFIAPKKSS